MSDIDPAAVMAAHHRCHPTHPWCAVDGCEGEWPCEPYRLAEALAAERAKVERVKVLRKRWAFMGGEWAGFADDLDAALADHPEQAQP